jgi:hypothetical protein
MPEKSGGLQIQFVQKETIQEECASSRKTFRHSGMVVSIKMLGKRN